MAIGLKDLKRPTQPQPPREVPTQLEEPSARTVRPWEQADRFQEAQGQVKVRQWRGMSVQEGELATLHLPHIFQERIYFNPFDLKRSSPGTVRCCIDFFFVGLERISPSSFF